MISYIINLYNQEKAHLKLQVCHVDVTRDTQRPFLRRQYATESE